MDTNSRKKKSMSGQAAEKVRQQRQITIMLIVVCITFIVLIMPNCIFYFYKNYWKVEPNTREEAQYRLVYQVGERGGLSDSWKYRTGRYLEKGRKLVKFTLQDS